MAEISFHFMSYIQCQFTFLSLNMNFLNHRNLW